jgi:hypothetical protein
MSTAHSNSADSIYQAAMKVSISWLGIFFGSITLQDVAIGMTIVYTAIQIYILIRDKIIRDKPTQAIDKTAQ